MTNHSSSLEQAILSWSFSEESSLATSDVPSHITAVLEVCLPAVQKNYLTLQRMLAPSRAAAVVKADAYHVGAIPIALALQKVGCNDFFLATIEEGIALRKVLPQANLYIFNGVLPHCEKILSEHNLTPVLVSFEQIKRWALHGYRFGMRLPCLLHVDTGMARNGLDQQNLERFLEMRAELEPHLTILGVISHLSCSSHEKELYNPLQRQRFKELLEHFPGLPSSLSNSSGIFLDPSYMLDMARIGLGLFGYSPFPHAAQLLQPALALKGRIIEIRSLPEGSYIGYDRTFKTISPSKIATIGLGYADGLPLAASNAGIVTIEGYSAPIVGRISMDYTTLDVSNIPDHLIYEGAWVTFWDEAMDIKNVADYSKTHIHELLTRLGNRIKRIYKEEV